MNISLSGRFWIVWAVLLATAFVVSLLGAPCYAIGAILCIAAVAASLGTVLK